MRVVFRLRTRGDGPFRPGDRRAAAGGAGGWAAPGCCLLPWPCSALPIRPCLSLPRCVASQGARGWSPWRCSAPPGWAGRAQSNPSPFQSIPSVFLLCKEPEGKGLPLLRLFLFFSLPVL